jgi:SSS family transporter
MSIEIVIILVYLVGVNIIALRSSRVRNMADYFLGGRSIHWAPAALSIVATETSTLTFISIPGLAYTKGIGFMQLAAGYIIGRILVALLLVPGYFRGELSSTYGFLRERFGPSSMRSASLVFMVTRLLADSVRLFATAIPLSLLTGWEMKWCIALIAAATILYTLYGGLKAVIVADSIQMVLYVASGLAAIVFIVSVSGTGAAALMERVPGELLRAVTLDAGQGLFAGYTLVTGLAGGAFLSFASHGTDHLLVQRLLSCRDRKNAKVAVVASGLIIFAQFALFLFLGLLIHAFLGGQAFQSPDRVMPFFITEHLPAGLAGLMLAGVFAAAMSSLSSSINSLASSTLYDLLPGRVSEGREMGLSRLTAVAWTLALTGSAFLFAGTTTPLVEIGLGIASVTYGGILGVFAVARSSFRVREVSVLAGLLVSVGVLFFVATSTDLFWTWYVPLGGAICLSVTLAVEFIGRTVFRTENGYPR